MGLARGCGEKDGRLCLPKRKANSLPDLKILGGASRAPAKSEACIGGAAVFHLPLPDCTGCEEGVYGGCGQVGEMTLVLG